ncbi:MAG: PIN domain-containing protein [Pyrinomonadaceae bacterium MAG19_C2-C3]|nr:PIN domain-containing protein [Pyrinomonadaceae bacterium MAG19_C2-C3]
MSITDLQREIVVSLLLALELYPAAMEAKRSTEVAALKSFFNMAMYRVPVDDDLMENAIKEASKIYTLGALDAAHIAAAKAAGCDEFITTEKPSKPMFKVRGIKIVHFN